MEDRIEKEENNKATLIDLITTKINQDKLDDLTYEELRIISDILGIACLFPSKHLKFKNEISTKRRIHKTIR